jgi:hypothetical protein
MTKGGLRRTGISDFSGRRGIARARVECYAAKLSGSIHCDITPAAIGTEAKRFLITRLSALGIGIIGVGPLTGIKVAQKYGHPL